MKHVVQFSGGIGSWAAGKRIAQQHGAASMVLLFADTMIEHADTYAFLEAAAANIGAPLVRIADGRTPFEVFRDRKFLGNTQRDPCSDILKRKMCDRWLRENCDPEETTLVFGIHWSEKDRLDAIQKRNTGWRCVAPLCEPPLIAYGDLHAWAKVEGLPRQFLYEIGMPHANCGGGCVKMGQGGWVTVYQKNRAWKRPRPTDTKIVLVWDKGGALGMGDLSIPWKCDHEEIYVLGKGFIGRRDSGSVIRCPPVQSMAKNGRAHPNEKPVELMMRLCAKVPGLVLDPFMGSGSTGVACMKLGKPFIGVEVVPEYFEIACERIAAAWAQPRLFADEETRPNQAKGS